MSYSVLDNNMINMKSNKDNKNLSKRETNTRIFDREMTSSFVQKINPLNRLDIERDEFLRNSNNNSDSDDDNYIKNSHHNSNQVNFDKRMPMQPDFNINAPVFEMSSHSNNARSSLKNVSSFSNNDYADINADTRLTENLQTNTTCVTGINNYGLFLFDNMISIMNGPFIISPYLIYTIFASLYLASDGNTEVELKNYFNFPRTDIISEGLKEILYDNNRFGNCIVFSDEIEYDQSFCNNINKFTKIRKVNINNANQEANTINEIIKRMSGIEKRSITGENIKNTSVLLLNYGCINPIWTSHFTKTMKDNNVEFMIAYNQTFGYFEQPNLQVLELTSTDNLCFGIIYGDIDINDKTYKLITSSLKPTILEEVKIPKFKIQTKLRYTNLLKETDLKTVFLDLKTPYLFGSECEISDCLHNIEFTLSENSVKQEKKLNGFKTTKKFIVNSSFRFYLRSANNNMLLILGSF